LGAGRQRDGGLDFQGEVRRGVKALSELRGRVQGAKPAFQRALLLMAQKATRNRYAAIEAAASMMEEALAELEECADNAIGKWDHLQKALEEIASAR